MSYGGGLETEILILHKIMEKWENKDIVIFFPQDMMTRDMTSTSWMHCASQISLSAS
jgi:hypothetical protein